MLNPPFFLLFTVFSTGVIFLLLNFLDMGRNKKIKCGKCLESMRSDNVKRHSKVCRGRRNNRAEDDGLKRPIKQCDVCKKLMSTAHLARHKRKHKQDPLVDIRDVIKDDERKMQDSRQVGEALREEIQNKTIDLSSLRNEFLKAINLESTKVNNCIPDIFTLRPWQEQLLPKLIPTDRLILWIVGNKGAEGKSWFQKHIVNLLGDFRVFNSTIDRRGDSLIHALAKRQLPLIDTFVFNIPRSFSVEEIPYTLFEDIKDGRAMSTKYDSKEIKFCVPNIVVIFANELPIFEKMSPDRWNVFYISDDQLVDKYPLDLLTIKCSPWKEQWKNN